jgi:acyl carrier protein
MDTLARLIKVFNAVFDGTVETEAVTPEASLREDIGINSIGLLYMAMAVEEEFGIKFNNEDFPAMVTVGDVVACIEGKL